MPKQQKLSPEDKVTRSGVNVLAITTVRQKQPRFTTESNTRYIRCRRMMQPNCSLLRQFFN